MDSIVFREEDLKVGVGRDLGQQDTGQFCWQKLPVEASSVEAAVEDEVGGAVCVCVCVCVCVSQLQWRPGQKRGSWSPGLARWLSRVRCDSGH